MATWYVDLNGGSDSNNGTSFAQRVKTLSKAATLATAGDTVRVMGNAPTNIGTANWTNGSALVTLSSARNQLVYADGAWTAATNVTCTAPTSSPSPKEGSNSAQMACNGSFSTGKVAHKTTGTINLSSYQQISFWVRATAALAANTLRIDLCSDTGGNTIVNSLTLNVALNANQWTAITLNYGAALGSSIQSVRLHALTSMASKTVQIDNIIACKAPSASDCLTLNSLISPDSATWYHVQSINGTSVYIDGQQSTAAQAAKGYQGATASGATFYILQPTQVSIASASSTYAQTFSLNGSAANQITISGGWDSTAMSSQNGWTTIDMSDWTASGVNLTGTTGYITVDKFNFARCANPLGLVANSKGYAYSNGTCAGTGSFSNMPTHGMTVSSCNFLNTSGTTAMLNIPLTQNYNTDGVAWNISNTKLWGCTVDGIDVPAFVGSPGITISGCSACGTGGYGFNVQSPCGNFSNNTANNNANPGFYFQNAIDHIAYNLTAQGNGTAQVQLNHATVEIYGLNTNASSALPQINVLSGASGKAVVYNWTQYTGGSPAAKLTSLGDPATGETSNNSVASQKENGTAANNSIYTDYGIVTTTGVTGHGGTTGWKLSPNSNAFESSPLRLNVAKVACPANVLTTVTFWAQLSAAGPSARLKVFGGRHAGVGSPGTNITTSISGTSWAQFSVAFTPTENCVIDVFAEVWGSSSQSLTISGPVVINQ